MKTLTNKQLEIIEPLKKIVSLEFYEIQKESMMRFLNSDQLQRSYLISESLNQEQIKKCREIREQLEDYKNGLRGAVDMVREGLNFIEDALL